MPENYINVLDKAEVNYDNHCPKRDGCKAVLISVSMDQRSLPPTDTYLYPRRSRGSIQVYWGTNPQKTL